MHRLRGGAPSSLFFEGNVVQGLGFRVQGLGPYGILKGGVGLGLFV